MLMNNPVGIQLECTSMRTSFKVCETVTNKAHTLRFLRSPVGDLAIDGLKVTGSH